MPSYRCSLCSINYDPNVPFRVCVICDEKIDYFSNVDHDPDWRKAVEFKRAGLTAPGPGTPLAEQQPEHRPGSPHPVNDTATVIYDNVNDRVLVSKDELGGLGYLPESFDIIRLNGKYYEVLDYHRGSRLFTIERVDVYDWLAELDVFTGEPYNGPSSDDILKVELDDGTSVWWDPRENGPGA